MIINIPKVQVFAEVEKRSSLEGYLLADKYDAVWANENKGRLLESYWIEGCGAVIQMLRDFLGGVTNNVDLQAYNSSEELSLDVTLPNRYNQGLIGSMTTGIKMMIACNILSRWLGVCAPELSPKYDDEAKSYLEDIRIKLFSRKAPSRTMVVASEDIESADKNEANLGGSSDEVLFERDEAFKSASSDNEPMKTVGDIGSYVGMDVYALNQERKCE